MREWYTWPCRRRRNGTASRIGQELQKALRDTIVRVNPVFFVLERDGRPLGAFSDCAISTAVEPMETMAGEEPGAPQARRIPPTVVLARSHSDDLQVFDWYQSVLDGGPADARRDCTLTVHDATGVPVGRYRLDMAWPFRVEVGLRERNGEETLTETVTLTCESVRRVAL